MSGQADVAVRPIAPGCEATGLWSKKAEMNDGATVAYLINQYPQTSQSFIRREIAALEAQGLRVVRYSLRAAPKNLIEPADIAERDKTRAVLNERPLKLLLAAIRTLLSRPSAAIRALRLATRVGRRSERGVLIHLVYLAEACVLRGWLARDGAVHLHAHFGTNSTTVAMLCRELGGPPYSFTCHGPEEFDSPRQLALGEKVHRSQFAVAISDFGRSQLFRWCALPDWPKVHVVRCIVDSAFLNGDGAITDQKPEPGRLVSIGRLSEQKGFGVLIEAAATLRKQGVPFTLTILGDGELRPVLQAAIDRNDLIDTVTLAGWADGAMVRREVRRARALVMASFAEGLPVVLMEALALRRPVIATHVAGIPELVEPGVCGWLVPAGSPEALSEAMKAALLASDEELERMGVVGAERVGKMHCGEIESGKLAELFGSGHAE
jgi:glycosyltransferase involved in cell wall biosynthesis